MNQKITADELAHSLTQFCGTERLVRHWTGAMNYTDGVAYLAKHAAAHWLIDAIASYQRSQAIRQDEMLRDFQLWQLVVNLSARSAVLTCVTDAGSEPTIRQEIEFTDFSLQEIKMYVSDGVLMLPSEY